MKLPTVVLLLFSLATAGAAAPTASLANASARVSLPAGGVATLGFVVASRGTYLVRAVGPTLAAFGVTRPAGHPTLTVFQGGTVIARNANWILGPYSDVDDPEGWIRLEYVRTITRLACAFPLTSAVEGDSLDAAETLWLEPGAYTVVCRNDGAAGDALVEVYAVPSF